ncbi:MAG TPA: hypothetical protein VGM19_04125 [Armatimonadota bacterium]|jgi:hypothetical protein
MDLTSALQQLDLSDFASALSPGWDLAQAALPPDGAFFLAQAFVIEACEAAWLPAVASATTLAAAELWPATC